MNFALELNSKPEGCKGVEEVTMVDKHRHRRVPAPRGAMSGWALMAFFVCSAIAIGVARVLV